MASNLIWHILDITNPLGIFANFPKIAIFAQIASLQWAGTFSPLSPALWRFLQNLHFRPNRQSPMGWDVFAIIASPMAISPKSPFSPKSPVSNGLGRFRHYRQPYGDFPKISIFAMGPGRFSPLSPALWRFPQNLHFRPNRQSPWGRDVFRHYRQPSGEFRQNRQFCQNRQSPRGHVWHPTQIVRGWRFFAISAIFAIACNS